MMTDQEIRKLPHKVVNGVAVALTADEIAQREAEIAAEAAIVRVPRQVTPLQARRALRAAGLLDQINAYVATQDADAQDAWEYATVIERNNPIIASAAAALGMTGEQIDGLFVAASKL